MTEPRDSFGPLWLENCARSAHAQAVNKRTRNIHKGTRILRSSRLPVVMSKKQGEKEFPTENGRDITGAMKGGAK